MVVENSTLNLYLNDRPTIFFFRLREDLFGSNNITNQKYIQPVCK